MKTLQEAFNTIYKHLHSMKEMSIDGSGNNCMYRGCNGNKCAVGVLIDDEHYSEGIEAKEVEEDMVLNALRLSGCTTTTIDTSLYMRMQEIHDDLFHHRDREGRIENIAEEFELCIPSLEH